MISFKQFLLEFELDTKIIRDTEELLIIQGTIEQDGKITKVKFFAGMDDPDENVWMISFVDATSGLHSSGKTDSGAQFAVKNFVVSCLRTLIQKHNPEGLAFSADKSEEDFGPTRASVYARVMAREFKQFKHVPLKQSGDEEFFLYRLNESMLNEIAAYSRDFEITKATERTFLTAKTIGTRRVEFLASLMNQETGHWDISFSERKSEFSSTYRKTGSGKEFEVAGFVVSSLIEFIGRYNPEVFSFSAEKELGADDARADVYEKLLSRLLRGPLKQYKMNRKTHDEYDGFIVRRR